MWGRGLVAVLVVVLGGCVNEVAQRRSELTVWVGRPEAELVGAMGVPNRTYNADGMKFLTYEERRTEIVPGSPFYYGPSPFLYGGGGGFPPTETTLICDTTFTIAGGTVRAFSFRGNACG